MDVNFDLPWLLSCFADGGIGCPACVCCGPKPVGGCCHCCTSPAPEPQSDNPWYTFIYIYIYINGYLYITYYK